MKLKISPANTKTVGLMKVRVLKPYLTGKRKVFSLDLLSGYSCPFADKCLSKVIIVKQGGIERRRIKDGPNTEFRCFSASQEVLFPKTYDARNHNLDLLRNLKKSPHLMSQEILKVLPKNVGIVRIHVAGDFFNENYFKAWIKTAKAKPDVLFYAYTKSLKYWIKNMKHVPSNLILTASYGGRDDHLIEEHNLRYVKVVNSVYAARKLKLPIDKSDECAVNPKKRNKSFALLIHGIQPKGSRAGKAVYKLNGKGSYGKVKQ